MQEPADVVVGEMEVACARQRVDTHPDQRQEQGHTGRDRENPTTLVHAEEGTESELRLRILVFVDTPATLPAPPARRRRLRRWLPLSLLALVVLVALAPFLSGPILRTLIVDAIEDELDAEARVQAVSFAWPARVRVRGLELTDASGAPLAALDELRASLELWPLLFGRIRAEVELSYPEIHLSRAEDGLWNWEQPLAKARPRSGAERDVATGAEAVPDVRARLRLADGHVRVHGPHGDTTLGDIQLEVDLDGLERPAPFRLALGLRGPLGPAGGLTLEGSFTAAAGGRIDVLGFAGKSKLALQELQLAGLAPALELLAGAGLPVDGLAGVLSGEAEFTLAAGLALAGQSDIQLRDLTLRGPLAPAELTRIDLVELRGRATQQGEGAGSQQFELRADSFLSVTYAGRSSLPARGAGEVGGTLTLSAELEPLAQIARGWLPLQAGVAIQGRVEAGLELETALADRRPTAARVQARAGIEGLAARDAAGRALDLAELEGLALELDAAADLERGTLSVPKFDLRAGPVSCAGRLEAAGLALDPAARALELRSGALQLAADLEKLRGTLAQLVAFEGAPFGGRLSADGTLSGAGEDLELAAKIEGSALSFGGVSLADLHGQLDARRAQGGVLSGSGTVRLGALALRLAGREPVQLPGATLELTLREDAAGKGEHALGLRTSDGALELGLRASSERRAGALELQTSLSLDGRVAELARLAAPFAPMQPGLSGDLRATGELSAKLLGGALDRAGGRLEIALSDLGARDAAGAPLALQALARTTLALEGEFDARADRAELRSFTLTAGGLELSGSGRVLELARAPALEDGKLALQADLARLGPELARVLDLAGWNVSGSPLTAEVQLSTKEQRIEAEGRLACATLRLGRPDDSALVLADLGLDFDLGYDTALGSLHVRKASARSSTAALQLSGTLNELLTPARARGAMQLELTGELARILGDLGLETPQSGRRTAGTLGAKLALEGDGGSFRVSGKSTIERFRLELAPAAEGQAPLVVEDPAITLDCSAQVTLAALDVDLTRLTLESELARGGVQGRIENLRGLGTAAGDARAPGAGEVRFVGLKGQFAYVPDRLGVVLAPFLPGKLGGAEEQRLDFTLDGRARDFALATLLTGTVAHVNLGLGRFERPEIQLDGTLRVEVKDEKLRLTGDLGANGGTLQLDGELDLAQGKSPPRSKLTLTAKAVRANEGLAPLLALLHPAFGAAELAQGSLEGLIGLSLDVSYDAPLSLEALGAGWESLPKAPISGAGRLELSQAALRGSPLLALLGNFGVDATQTLDVRPIEFTIQKGRVTYAKPWTWTLAGTETTFTGSLGLDQSLDLAWNLPITDELIKRWSYLESLKGERLSIPLRGSVQKPRLEADQLLKDLAAKAAKSELESRLGLGGKAGGDDPASLLERADVLWSKGQKAEAAALYLRLREEFKLSLPYALNKDRIKERSKHKEPPK